MIRRLFTILLIVGFSVPIFAAPQGESGEETMQTEDTSALEGTPNDPRLFRPGQLTVATGEPVFPPWMFDDDPAGGEGFENGIVYALAEELGFDRDDVVWVRRTFDQGIAPGSKPYDFNIQQFSKNIQSCILQIFLVSFIRDITSF